MSIPSSWRCLALALVLLAPATYRHGLAQQSSAPGPQARPLDLFKPKQEQLLPPEQAFRIRAAAKGPALLQAELIPADGYYLYRERIHFTVKNPGGVAIKTVRLPDGKLKKDPTFGTTQIYEQPILAEITLERAPQAGQLTLEASYQGCHEKTGVCYPPVTTELKLALPPAK